MSKPRIVHIITRLDQGGSAENTLYSVAELKKIGYETVLLTGPTLDPLGWINDYIIKHSVKIVHIPSLVRPVGIWNDIQAFFNLYLFFKKNPCDIVHTHSSKAGFIGRWAAFFAGVKIIIHTPHGHVFYGYFGTSVSTFFVYIEKLTACITTRMICLTHGELKDYLAFNVASARACITIHSGVELDTFIHARIQPETVKQTLGFLERHRIVGTITRLEPVKGNRYLIHAWKKVSARIPDAKLLIIGEGKEKKELEMLIDDLGIGSSVVMLGLRKDLPELLSIMELFVLPSINEGMGKVLIQAAAMGKPAVGSHICGIPDIIKHEETGLLVPPEKPDALAEALLRLLDNPGKARTMGNNARLLVTGEVDGYPRFSKEAMIHKLDMLYKELLKN